MTTGDAAATERPWAHSSSGLDEQSPLEPSPSRAGLPGFLGGRLQPSDPIAPTVVFALITVFITIDLVDDILRNENPGHLAGMVVGTLLSMAGLVLMLRTLKASRARSRELEIALDRTREDSVRWREQAGQILQGVGALIDRQFQDWGLSNSEREVALLLLKGLSLKSIAEARDSSEPTVRQQAQSVYRKARLAGRAELAAFFLEDLLLPPAPAADPRSPAAPARRT